MSIHEVAKASVTKWMLAPPASEDAIARLVGEVGFDLPADYLEFLRFSNGGCGDIPVQPWCFDSLWKAEELVSSNRDYEVAEYCSGFFGIGTSGGGEMFAFDMRKPQPWPVVVVPFIGMEADAPQTFVLLFRCLDRKETMTPNHALHRTRPSRSGCNRAPSWAGSLSLGR